MKLFGGSKANEELALVFDVRSGSVGGALFYMSASGIPKIIFSRREPLILEKSLDIDKFLTLTGKALDVVAGEIAKAGVGAPQKIYCVLSSPWYESETRVIGMDRNTPFVFTSRLANELIDREIGIFKQQYLAKYPNIGNAVRLLEMKNIKTMLNGYETDSPLDHQARNLQMTLFVSVSGEQILKKIEETIAGHFHEREIKFASFAMASFALVRGLYAKQDNFLLIDIGGEMTDISMIKKNILRESASFPLGHNFLARGVAGQLRISLEEARSLISLFKDGHAADATYRKLSPIMQKLKEDWLKNFQEALANLSKDISVPATIYLSTDRDLADFFCELIKTEQFNQYTLTESKFSITYLDTDVLHGAASFTENTARDSFLIIDSVYLNHFAK